MVYLIGFTVLFVLKHIDKGCLNVDCRYDSNLKNHESLYIWKKWIAPSRYSFLSSSCAILI